MFSLAGLWVCGLMANNAGCEFRDRDSIPSVCQITDVDKNWGKLANLNHILNGGLLLY